MPKITKKKAPALAVGQSVAARGLAGTVSRLNEDGTCSVRLAEPVDGATFLHRVSQKELEIAGK